MDGDRAVVGMRATEGGGCRGDTRESAKGWSQTLPPQHSLHLRIQRGDVDRSKTMPSAAGTQSLVSERIPRRKSVVAGLVAAQSIARVGQRVVMLEENQVM